MMAKQRQGWITTVYVFPKIFFQSPLSQFATQISFFFFFLICSSVSSNLLGGVVCGCFFFFQFYLFILAALGLRCNAQASRSGGSPVAEHRLQACRLHQLHQSSPVVVAQGLSLTEACGILPDRGSNSTLLHWQADSQPLDHQGSPITVIS